MADGKLVLRSVVMGPWSVAINYRRATHDRGDLGSDTSLSLLLAVKERTPMNAAA